jgi:hypothetical protein
MSDMSDLELLLKAKFMLEEYSKRLHEMQAHRDEWRTWALDWHGEHPNMPPPPDATLRWE